MSKLPDDLPKRLRAAGLKVNEVSGWQSRGRPASTGSFHPVGVLCHHTATGPRTSNADVLQLLIRGRSDLPGPLAHFGLDRSGVVHIVAAGRANHAGKAKASGSVAAGDGNSLYIGIEAFNDGRGEGWPDAQYDAYVKLCAVLSREITGNSAQTVRGHKETSVTGKVDPLFSMGDFRDRVAAALKATPPKDDPTPTIPEKEPGMKDVEYGRLLATKAAQAFDDAKVKGKPRPAVRVMAAAIRAALKAGPKK